MNYYIVRAKCGHVGRDKYMPIAFPICAESREEASAIARTLPRVKKDHKDAIISSVKVSKLAFKVQQVINELDPYLNVFTRHDQDEIMHLIVGRIMDEEKSVDFRKKDRKECIKYKKAKEFIKCSEMEQEILHYC